MDVDELKYRLLEMRNFIYNLVNNELEIITFLVSDGCCGVVRFEATSDKVWKHGGWLGKQVQDYNRVSFNFGESYDSETVRSCVQFMQCGKILDRLDNLADEIMKFAKYHKMTDLVRYLKHHPEALPSWKEEETDSEKDLSEILEEEEDEEEERDEQIKSLKDTNKMEDIISEMSLILKQNKEILEQNKELTSKIKTTIGQNGEGASQLEKCREEIRELAAQNTDMKLCLRELQEERKVGSIHEKSSQTSENEQKNQQESVTTASTLDVISAGSALEGYNTPSGSETDVSFEIVADAEEVLEDACNTDDGGLNEEGPERFPEPPRKSLPKSQKLSLVQQVVKSSTEDLVPSSSAKSSKEDKDRKALMKWMQSYEKTKNCVVNSSFKNAINPLLWLYDQKLDMDANFEHPLWTVKTNVLGKSFMGKATSKSKAQKFMALRVFRDIFGVDVPKSALENQEALEIQDSVKKPVTKEESKVKRADKESFKIVPYFEKMLKRKQEIVSTTKNLKSMDPIQLLNKILDNAIPYQFVFNPDYKFTCSINIKEKSYATVGLTKADAQTKLARLVLLEVFDILLDPKPIENTEVRSQKMDPETPTLSLWKPIIEGYLFGLSRSNMKLDPEKVASSVFRSYLKYSFASSSITFCKAELPHVGIHAVSANIVASKAKSLSAAKLLEKVSGVKYENVQNPEIVRLSQHWRERRDRLLATHKKNGHSTEKLPPSTVLANIMEQNVVFESDGDDSWTATLKPTNTKISLSGANAKNLLIQYILIEVFDIETEYLNTLFV